MTWKSQRRVSATWLDCSGLDFVVLVLPVLLLVLLLLLLMMMS